MITLFWCPQTRASRALWMLEEVGRPFEVRLIDIRDPEKKKDPDFVRASPMGKVPAIMDATMGGTVYLADSAPIALYLADRYPAAHLAPAINDPARAPFLYWLNYTPGVIEPAMMERFLGMEVSRATSGWGDFDSMIEVLEQGLEDGPWLLGDAFTAADVLVGSSVWFMQKFGILPDSPVLEAYIGRCLERPAYQKALAREDELDAG